MEGSWFSAVAVGSALGLISHAITGTFWVSWPMFFVGFLGTIWYTLEKG